MNDQITVGNLLTWIESIAPAERAEDWDHIGLMIGSVETEVRGIVFSLDVSAEAIDLCLDFDANILITHHPLFFSPLFSIDTDTPRGRLVSRLIREQISVISAHTNLDRADYGVNHALADTLGLRSVPEQPEFSFGLLCDTGSPLRYLEFSSMVRRVLQSSGVFLNEMSDKEITRIYLGAGSFDDSVIPDLIRSSVDLVVAGEIKHHAMVQLKESGICAVAAGHEATERVVLPFLQTSLVNKYSSVRCCVFQGNRFESSF